MTRLEQALKEVSYMLYEKMDMLLPENELGDNNPLIEAMRYSSLSDGKRLRPFLTITTSNLFGVSKTSSLQIAAAIEFVHAYSLIHDDLPAMDNDEMRRGKSSCHIKFDEATAILAGDSLLTLAFEIMASSATHYDPGVRCELVYMLAKSAGYKGMLGGQMLDISANRRSKLSINQITRLQKMKTGAMFVISCEAGAILGKSSKQLRNAIRGYANDLGLAFQITDDILDYQQDNRMDKSSAKATFVNAMGIDKAKEQSKLLAKQAVSHLDIFDERADLLRELVDFIIND